MATAAALAGVHDCVLHDASRQRDIPVKIYAPETLGKFPVIVFSHGLGGSKESYRYLGKAWSAHGYVVLVPTHAGSDNKIFKRGRPLRNLRALQDSALDARNWSDRPADVSFVISSFAEIEKLVPALHGKLDPTRIGVGGHSFGAYTAGAVAGANDAGMRDDRPRAFVAMSPQGEGGIPSHPDGWARVDRPFFAITGTRDRGLGGQPPEWRLQPYAHMKPGAKYLAVLRDADHMTFAGLGPPSAPPFLDAIRSLTLTFWDAYLKDDAKARARLDSGALGSDAIRFEHK